MNIKNIILTVLLSSITFADNAVYFLYPGPNLVSFPILSDEQNIETMFSPIEENIISIIGQGEIGLFNEGQWIGGLNTIDNMSGYWVTVNELSLLEIEGDYDNSAMYLLNTGANLISYPFNSPQPLSNAIPFYIYENIYAIIGANQAALFTDSGIVGSLTHFEPNKGYWFFMISPNPFIYNQPNQFISNTDYNMPLDDETDLDYSQSTNQSIFFIENAFVNGESIILDTEISIYCNDIKVGGKEWIGNMTDIIAMGDDGYEFTENYCQNFQNIAINIFGNDSSINMHIIGNTEWMNNEISIISLSSNQIGDLNFDNNLNITDIIKLIEHIVDINTLDNQHAILIADSNQDNLINVTDIVINLETILE